MQWGQTKTGSERATCRHGRHVVYVEHLGPVVRRVDNFTQRINPYPADKIGAFLILIWQQANFIHWIGVYPLVMHSSYNRAQSNNHLFLFSTPTWPPCSLSFSYVSWDSVENYIIVRFHVTSQPLYCCTLNNRILITFSCLVHQQGRPVICVLCLLGLSETLYTKKRMSIKCLFSVVVTEASHWPVGAERQVSRDGRAVRGDGRGVQDRNTPVRAGEGLQGKLAVWPILAFGDRAFNLVGGGGEEWGGLEEIEKSFARSNRAKKNVCTGKKIFAWLKVIKRMCGKAVTKLPWKEKNCTEICVSIRYFIYFCVSCF